MRSAMSTYKAAVRASLVPVPRSAAVGNTAAIPWLLSNFQSVRVSENGPRRHYSDIFQRTVVKHGLSNIADIFDGHSFRWDSISTTGFGALLGTGIAATGWLTAPTATGQAILMYACDMIIVFERTLWNMTKPDPTHKIKNAAE